MIKTDLNPPILLTPAQRSYLIAGIFLGMGLAGFFDGIILHQILQWHHMLTAVRPIRTLADLQLNTLWDGFFHLLALALSGGGLGLLWRATQQELHLNRSQSLQLLGSTILLGFGGFNLIEGLIDHQILGIHHVKSGPHQLFWDLSFLGIAALCLLTGLLWLRHQFKSLSSPS